MVESEEFSAYSNRLINALSTINQDCLNELYNQIYLCINSNKSIYILGNGGSHANATHIAGDYLKTFAVGGMKLKISNPLNNSCFLTAASNDISFEDSYSILFNSILGNNDLVIYLSGSGNSMNLVKCARSGKKIDGLYQVALTAYNGGALSKEVDLSLHCKIDDMEIAEDVQLIVFHYLKQKLCQAESLKWDKDLMPKYEKRTMDDLVS